MKSSKQRIVDFILNNKAVFIAVIMAVIIGSIEPLFFTTANMFNVLRQICSNVILAVGFTFVLGLGEIDLSIGAVVGLNGVIMAKLMTEANCPIWLSILVGVACGALTGVINSSIISALSIPPFIVTLATQSVFRGVVYVITKMAPISTLPEAFNNIGQGYVGSVPIPVIIMVVVVVVGYFIANYTVFGRHVIACGSSMDAAKACGINTKRVRMGVFVMTGICAALASIVTTSRAASAQVSAGLNAEQDVIAAVVIGGTAMSGGNMNPIGTVFGCLIVGMITNAMNLMGVNSNYQVVAKGLLILLALVIDRVSAMVYENTARKQALKDREEKQKA